MEKSSKNALPFSSVTYFSITIRLIGCMFFNKFTTIAFIPMIFLIIFFPLLL